jgi:hypothetical protein
MQILSNNKMEQLENNLDARQVITRTHMAFG